MKDLQILWAACKYHWRKFKRIFKEQELLHDDMNNYYYEGNYQRVLYWRAYKSWQTKRYFRNQCTVGTDLFEADTNISEGTKNR